MTDHSVFCPRAAVLSFSLGMLSRMAPWASSCVPAEAVVLRPKLAGSFALVTGFCGKSCVRKDTAYPGWWMVVSDWKGKCSTELGWWGTP